MFGTKIRKDRRQVNEVWEFTNWLGERFRFARIGSRRNAYITTLAYLGNGYPPDVRPAARE